MGYHGALKSVENVTKAVMRLSNYLRQKFYLNLGERIYDMNNLLVLIVKTEIKKK